MKVEQSVREGESSLTAPNLVMYLAYVLLLTHNGMKIQCTNVADIESEIEYWSTSIACFVLGSNPPIQVIERVF